MEALFSKILDMSLTASIVILAVLAARYFLRNSPKVISYALWAVVLFRLLCPVSLTAPISLLEVTQPRVTVTTQGTSTLSYLPEIQPEPAAPQQSAPSPSPEAPTPPQIREESPKPDWSTLLAWVWALGVAVMAGNCLCSCFQLSLRLMGAVPFRGRVYLSDHIPTPFVLGILRPRIYLPSDTPEAERPYILAHEEHHIRRLDHIFKLLAYAALCLHWFNPLVWLAFFLAGQDMEMSCDEAVIRKFGPEIRADYAQSLLRLATSRRAFSGVPLAFGEGDTKGRVKNMANWKQPKSWAVVIAILLCTCVLVACAVNPAKDAPTDTEATAPLTESTESTEPATPEAVSIGLSLPSDVVDVDCGDGEIQFFAVVPIPGQFSSQPDTTQLLGGVRTYETPAVSIQNIEDWLTALGVPQIISGEYDYIASGSSYADLEASFIDAGGWETKHYYYVQGASVFELWFDTTRLDPMTQAAIQQSLSFAPDSRIQRSLPSMKTSQYAQEMDEQAQRSEEETYLDRCRTALEALQSQESAAFKISRNNYGGPILNDRSTSFYSKDSNNWVLIHQIPDEAFQRKFGQHGFLYVDGNCYTRVDWDEDEDILWGPTELDPGVLPWIETFDWDAQDVLFVSSMPAGKGMCFTLQVMAPYYESNPDSYSHYQVQFIFDEHVKLQRIETTFFFRNDQDGDYSSKETIQALDEPGASAIDYHHQRLLKQP